MSEMPMLRAAFGGTALQPTAAPQRPAGSKTSPADVTAAFLPRVQPCAFARGARPIVKRAGDVTTATWRPSCCQNRPPHTSAPAQRRADPPPRQAHCTHYRSSQRQRAEARGYRQSRLYTRRRRHVMQEGSLTAYSISSTHLRSAASSSRGYSEPLVL